MSKCASWTSTPGRGQPAAMEIGEILIRAPQIMDGYWHQPTETANMIRDGWVYTGDIGYLDEDGYLFIVDRKKDLIKPSGFQVWPREVEEVIATLPGRRRCVRRRCARCSAGRSGESLGGAQTWRAGHRQGNSGLLPHQAGCLQSPREIEFRDSLPKTMVGKTLRRMLREERRDRGASCSDGNQDLSGFHRNRPREVVFK